MAGQDRHGQQTDFSCTPEKMHSPQPLSDAQRQNLHGSIRIYSSYLSTWCRLASRSAFNHRFLLSDDFYKLNGRKKM